MGRPYAEEIKQEAVALVTADHKVKAIAIELGIPQHTVWGDRARRGRAGRTWATVDGTRPSSTRSVSGTTGGDKGAAFVLGCKNPKRRFSAWLRGFFLRSSCVFVGDGAGQDGSDACLHTLATVPRPPSAEALRAGILRWRSE